MLGCTKSYLSRAVRNNWVAGGDLQAPVAEWAEWNRKRTKISHFSIPRSWFTDSEVQRQIAQNVDPECDVLVGSGELYDEGELVIAASPVWLTPDIVDRGKRDKKPN